MTRKTQPGKHTESRQVEQAGGQEAPAESGSVLDSPPEGSHALLHRWDNTKAKMVLVGKMDAKEATEELIAERYGGGRFRVTERVPRETGGHVYGRSREITIAGPMKRDEDLPPWPSSTAPPAAAAPAAAAPAPPFSSAQAGMVELMEAVKSIMKENREQTTLFLAQIREQYAGQPRGDDTLVKLLTVLTPIIQALISRPTPNQPDTLKIISELKGFLAPKPAVGGRTDSPTDVIDSIVEAMRSLKNMSDELSPKDETAPELKTIAELTRVLAKGVEHAPAPAPVAAPVTPEAKLDPNLPPWKKVLLSNRKAFFRFAQVGADPELAAETAMTFISPALEPVIRAFVVDPQATALTVETLPELASYRPWVEAFLKELRGFLEGGEGEVTEGGTDEAGTSG